VKAVVLTGAAQLEIHAAARWYSDRQPGLGEEFIAEVGKTLDALTEEAQRYPFWKPERPFQKALVHRFPYVVFFVEEDRRVLILAVAHSRRKPGYWIRRQG
jgi:toxin ParE1/3/4